MQENGFYNVYDYGDSLTEGNEIKINHRISLNEDNADFSKLHNLSEDTLQKMRTESVEKENAIFKKLCASLGGWEKQAANTMLLDKAIEFVKVQSVKHTENKWVESKYGNYEISNMVYHMYYRIYENTKYDGRQGKSVPCSWELSWSVCTNAPRTNNYGNNKKVAGQENKKFTDKAEMQKYLDGRIAAYKHLFTETSPPIPKDFARPFYVNGILLKGYSLEGEKQPLGITVKVTPVRRRKPQTRQRS